ncbi:MAG: hypothetical protein LWX55_06060 [Deltaproteobacteria bacterium]|jgi:sugar phosphate isomerase/epimerase|nr:hypothetical protein [Deltaproteobacteria bacterium]
MKIFFSSTNIKRPLINGNISLKELPVIANQYEFDGIDILGRYIKNADLNHIISETKSLGLGVILSINTDLTVSTHMLNHQLEHFRNMLKLAKNLGASVITHVPDSKRINKWYQMVANINSATTRFMEPVLLLV